MSGINPTVRSFERKAFTTVFGQRIRLIRCFQEAMSVIMMGRFISHYGRTEWIKMNLEERTKYVINAYIYFLTIPCILSFFGYEIVNNPKLDKYFQQFRGYRKWKELYIQDNLPPITINTVFDFARELGYAIGFKIVLAKIGDIVGMPILFQQFIYEQFPKETWADYVNPFYVVDWINQNLNRDDFDMALTRVPSWLWYPIHPFIWLDWVVVKSYIQLYSAYEEIRKEHEMREYVQPFIPQMPIKLKIQGKEYYKTTLDTEGRATFIIPCEVYDQYLKEISIDALGLEVTHVEEAEADMLVTIYDYGEARHSCFISDFESPYMKVTVTV